MINKEIAISLKNVSKSFNKELSLKSLLKIILGRVSNNDLILSDISLKINKGDFVAIVGNNGAGKSTLLKLISGVLTPDNGSIYTNGKINAIHELTSGFNQELNGYENLKLLATLQGISKNELLEKLNNVISFSELSNNDLNKAIKYYSSGMKTRLAYAFNITFVKDILLLDEVLAVGDYNFIQKCITKLKVLSKKGVTILLVTHNIAQIEDLINKVYQISDKETQLISLEDYKSKFRKKGDEQFYIDSSLTLNSIIASNKQFNYKVTKKDFYSNTTPVIKLYESENINFQYNLYNNSQPQTIIFYAVISYNNNILYRYESIDYRLKKKSQIANFSINVPKLLKGTYLIILFIFSADKRKLLQTTFELNTFEKLKFNTSPPSAIMKDITINF